MRPGRRRSRQPAVGGAPDLLFEVRAGAWYGWPDFTGGEPIDRYPPEAGGAPEPVLANHDELPAPEEPLLRFDPHVAAVKLDVAPDDRLYVLDFGHFEPGRGTLDATAGSGAVWRAA